MTVTGAMSVTSGIHRGHEGGQLEVGTPLALTRASPHGHKYLGFFVFCMAEAHGEDERNGATWGHPPRAFGVL